VRRGVLTGSVLRAMAITVPLGVPLFFLAALITGQLGAVLGFSPLGLAALAGAGIIHFVWGRYGNYRATKALGTNLVAPIQQVNLVITLVLAIWLLGEQLTLIRMLGIVLVVLGPVVTMRDLGKILLRMSARRVIVGEVRDGAAHDMLKAFQVGVSGLCTVHAPSAVETLPRLEQLILEVSYDRQQHLIGEAIDLICHMTPYGDSWRVTELVAVDGWDGHQYNTRRLA